ncbi:transposase [Desulfocurvibacter africanus]|uniref:transposase n=1 Tax=Desulfocurvibacter africanus TaxID=873 RepID=UPI00110C427D|nr:transposase [Desulfocurvibacter africanus]
MLKEAHTLKEHLENTVTCRQRITNGTSEGLNSKIMNIKRRPAATGTRRTSRPPSTSSVAVLTSIREAPEASPTEFPAGP